MSPPAPGQISSETSYVLQRFGMRQPTYVNNIGTRVRDMEIRKIPGINEGISMKKAWSMMAEMNAVTLPIVDANNVLDGIITINDIATSYMENQDSTMIAKAKTPYCNILETLEAKMLVGDPDAVFRARQRRHCRRKPGRHGKLHRKGRHGHHRQPLRIAAFRH